VEKEAEGRCCCWWELGTQVLEGSGIYGFFRYGASFCLCYLSLSVVREVADKCRHDMRCNAPVMRMYMI
jgi:hypothetical protein